MSSHIFSLEPQPVPKIETANRLIHTPIPAPGTINVLEELSKLESRSMHGQLPIVWDKADDFNIFDMGGNKFIDFTSGIFVANVGHSNHRILSYMQKALDKSLISCYAYPNELRAEYLKKLNLFTDDHLEKAFLLSAGTEATEGALKLIRLHGQKIKKRRLGIICMEGNWHGRTLGAQMMSGNLAQKEWIGYSDSDVHHIPFPYPWNTEAKDAVDFLEKGLQKLTDQGIDISQDIAGFMIETFQGWGAVFYPPEYIQAIESICKKYGILLAFDEMQSGFARTGRKFGYQHYDVKPDLICCGKGMGGGVPLSGVIGRAEILDLPDIGNMSSTHSANPLVCAAGIAVLEEIDSRNLVAETARKGDIFFLFLNRIKEKFPLNIDLVLGKGLIAAMTFKDSETGHPDGVTASKVSEKCMQKGLLVVHTGRESIKFGPPLTISDAALAEGLETLSVSIKEILSL